MMKQKTICESESGIRHFMIYFAPDKNLNSYFSKHAIRKKQTKDYSLTKTIYNSFVAREGCEGTSVVFESSSHQNSSLKLYD